MHGAPTVSRAADHLLIAARIANYLSQRGNRWRFFGIEKRGLRRFVNVPIILDDYDLSLASTLAIRSRPGKYPMGPAATIYASPCSESRSISGQSFLKNSALTVFSMSPPAQWSG